MNEGNIMTEYEAKFSSMGNPIHKLIAVRKQEKPAAYPYKKKSGELLWDGDGDSKIRFDVCFMTDRN